MSLKPRAPRLLPIFSIVAATLAPLLSAQIVTENAGTTPPTTPTLRSSLTYTEADNRRSLIWTQQFSYGIEPWLDASIEFPHFLDHDIEFTSAPLSVHRKNLEGNGDVTIEIKRRLYQSDDILASTRWAVFARGSIPTGDRDRTTGGIEIPKALQIGSGSLGLGLGTAFTVIRDRHRFSSEVALFQWEKRDRFRPGGILDLRFAYWFRLHPATYTSGASAIEVRPVLELL